MGVRCLSRRPAVPQVDHQRFLEGENLLDELCDRPSIWVAHAEPQENTPDSRGEVGHVLHIQVLEVVKKLVQLSQLGAGCAPRTPKRVGSHESTVRLRHLG